MSDNGSNLSRRSSSQTSRASTESKRAKALRAAPRRAGSKASASSSRDPDPSLTSFPSFSPELESKSTERGQAPANVARTISQKARQRKATLAGLTSASPAFDRQNALFDDSPRASLDIPGSLHLASDVHIERLIARTGAVKLIRQYAKDLAQRDAELSVLRVRADNRERELKKILREADVSSADIEKRLLRLEQADETDKRGSRASLDGLMHEAIATDMALTPVQTVNEMGNPLSSNVEAKSMHSRKNSLKDATLKANTIASRGSSRANSVLSETSEDVDATLRPALSSSIVGKVPSLQAIFNPPPQSSSYFVGGSKTLKKPKAADEVSVRSNQSSKSFASWTQIFTGKNLAGRARASSLEQGNAKQTPSEAESALAKLSKIKPNPTHARPRSAATNTMKPKPAGRRTPVAARLSSSPSHARKESNASLPLTVEMDSVLEQDTLPPTMTSHTTAPNGLLTDRFGFIYDQRRRRRENLQVPKDKRNRLSASAGLRSGNGSPPKGHERSSTPVSIDEDAGKKSWQEHLKPIVNVYAGRPKELLMHTPSAGAVVHVSAADVTGTITPPRPRDASASVSVSVSGLELHPSSISASEPQSTQITATPTEPGLEHEDENKAESGSSRLLLDQLNELHDTLQTERMTKWNDFLRRVRAERASNTDPASRNVPEADLLDGELIGIATLGRSSKQKAKYTHFKSLVLMGIPVALRPKIWAECSGATARRVPGYYEDLVMRSDEGTETDADIASQIKADISRTLTDNIFYYRGGTGVARLEEVLRAYSLHNKDIGYCQGMNLICASLLLICATPEDCFWLLVAVIDTILPSGYFSGSLLTARADQIVLREYVTTLLPTLSAKLEELNVELEACTFHWFLSLYAGVLTGGEALYRIWDIILALHASEELPNFNESRNLGVDLSSLNISAPSTPVTATSAEANGISKNELEDHDGTSSPFLFQLALSLLYLNQNQIMALESPAQVYSYINHSMTNHNISLDQLIKSSEALGAKVKMAEVLEKRKRAIESLGG